MLNKSRTIQRQDEKSSAVVVDNNEKLKTTMTTATMKPFRMQIVWFNVFRLALIHALALVGLIFSVVKIQWKTLVLSYGFLMILSLVGITAGNVLCPFCFANFWYHASRDNFQVPIAFGRIDRIVPTWCCASS